MKIEVIYPEVCCLFGDKANMRYLRLSLKNADVFDTPIKEMPRFLKEKPDMVYFGSCSESNQRLLIERLKDHKNRISELIEGGTVFLMTGNTFEIMGRYIENFDGTKTEALGIFDYYSVQTIPKRLNSLMLGRFSDIEIVGYTSRFSNTYKIPAEMKFISVTKGFGSHIEDSFEGVRYKNFFGTYLLGPLLIENPYFTEYLLKILGEKDAMPAYFCDAEAAYKARLAEFKSNIVFS